MKDFTFPVLCKFEQKTEEMNLWGKNSKKTRDLRGSYWLLQ